MRYGQRALPISLTIKHIMKAIRLTENEVRHLLTLFRKYSNPQEVRESNTIQQKILSSRGDVVHAVFVGAYSDRQLYGIFSDLKEAKRYSALFDDHYQTEDIETCIVDKEKGYIERNCWECRYTSSDNSTAIRKYMSIEPPSTKFRVRYVSKSDNNLSIAVGSFVSEEHAITLVDDIRKEIPVMIAAADWWANNLELELMRQRFTRCFLTLYHSNKEKRTKRGRFVVGVDYNPCDFLLEVLDYCGIVPKTDMFTADGIFPRKTKMIIEDSTIRVKGGYGAGWEQIYP